MGYYSDLDSEFRDSQKNPYIADVLGISYEELLFLDYDFTTDQSDDGLIYTYRIEFDENSPPEILNKIERLEHGRVAYIQPYELNISDYYQTEFDSITENENHFSKFTTEINDLKSLSSIKTQSPKLEEVLHRQILIGIIGTLETFLSEVFINLTLNDPVYFQNFIESDPEFKNRRFELSELFIQKNKIKSTAKKVMLDIIYHNIPRVKEMYTSTFRIKFPDISEVSKYVAMRHDLVHRNGKTKDGQKVETNNKAIDNLILCVSDLVSKIAKELKLDKLH